MNINHYITNTCCLDIRYSILYKIHSRNSPFKSIKLSISCVFIKLNQPTLLPYYHIKYSNNYSIDYS